MQHRSAGRCPGDDPPQARVEKPRLAIPITLIVDDPAPCINPLYYYRLQVDGKNYERHARSIPFDFLQHFTGVCQAHGVRGKFSITPESLTHTRALDLASGAMFRQSEQEWMAEQSLERLTAYMWAATGILREADFVSAGITQPVSFGGSRSDYARATLEAVRASGGPPVTFYFIDEHTAGPPFWAPEVVLLDRERGAIIISPAVFAELTASPTHSMDAVDTFLDEADIRVDWLLF